MRNTSNLSSFARFILGGAVADEQRTPSGIRYNAGAAETDEAIAAFGELVAGGFVVRGSAPSGQWWVRA